ncbi:MAG TPA: hypothetical protein VGO27_19165, partial [Candidatus Acidoferrum sp.]|nr:hypothetical protein [Candidatus Acidoferrum sp.]
VHQKLFKRRELNHIFFVKLCGALSKEATQFRFGLLVESLDGLRPSANRKESNDAGSSPGTRVL